MISPFNALWPTMSSSIHNTRNPALQSALASLPGYSAGLEQLTHLAAGIDELHRSPLTLGKIRQHLTDHVLDNASRGPLALDDILTEARSVEHDDRVATETRNAIISAGQVVMGKLDTTLSTAADRLLCHLHAELQQLLEEVRGKIFTGTAETAIDADRTSDYQRSLDWAAQYRHLRSAQRTLMTSMGGVLQISDNLLPGLLMGSVLQLFPDYGYWAADVPGPDGLVPARWPSLHWDADQRVQLGWMADHPEASPWVPTVAEYENQQTLLARARQEAKHHDANQSTRLENSGITDLIQSRRWN